MDIQQKAITMKKILYLMLFALMGWPFMGCSSDDESSNKTIGDWVEDCEECYLVEILSETSEEYTTVSIVEWPSAGHYKSHAVVSVLSEGLPESISISDQISLRFKRVRDCYNEISLPGQKWTYYAEVEPCK